MKSFRAFGGRREQFLHRAHRAVVQIGRARPNARQARGPVFLRAADARFFGRLVAGSFQFGQEFVETVGLKLSEKLQRVADRFRLSTA